MIIHSVKRGEHFELAKDTVDKDGCIWPAGTQFIPAGAGYDHDKGSAYVSVYLLVNKSFYQCDQELRP